MKFCAHCGKEIMDEAEVCLGCGCAVEKEATQKAASYDDCVKGAAATNAVSAIVLAVGVLCALFVNVWIGIVLCLGAELIAVSPNTKVQKAIRNNNRTLDKMALKETGKQCQIDLKAKHSAYRFSFVLAYISLACLIVFVLLGNALG